MYKRKPPHFNSLLNLGGKGFWQRKIVTKVADRTLWSKTVSRIILSLKLHHSENKTERTLVNIPGFSSIILCEQQQKDKRWKAADSYTPTQVQPAIVCGMCGMCGMLPTSLYTNQNRRCLIENRPSTHVYLTTYLSCLSSSRTQSSSSVIEQLKHTLMYS